MWFKAFSDFFNTLSDRLGELTLPLLSVNPMALPPPPTSYVLHPLLEVFLESVGVVILPGVAGPGVDVVAAVAVDPEVSELVFVAVDIADVSEPQASVDIAVVFVVLIPACVLVFEVHIPGPPRFFVLPKISSLANSSSSAEVLDKESVDSSSCVRTNYGCGSKSSNVDLRENRNLEHCYSRPNPDHNKLSDTNDLPIDATRNHSRRRGLHRFQGQRTHPPSQASLSPLEVQQIRWVEAEKFQYLYLPLPSLE